MDVLIARIVDVNEFGVAKAIAEGNEWKVYRTIRKGLETEKLKIGQYIRCSVLFDEDNDEFYLLRQEGNYCRTELEWLEQESKNM